jgi:hypothetical protein
MAAYIKPPDFIVQLQPKPTTDLKFEGVAIAMYGVEASAFDHLPFIGPPYIRLAFELAATAPDVDIPDVPPAWQFNPRGARRRQRSEADVLSLRARLLRALATRFDQLTPSLMLQPQCLMCGRELTDPASPRRRKPRQMLLSDFGWFDKP